MVTVFLGAVIIVVILLITCFIILGVKSSGKAKTAKESKIQVPRVAEDAETPEEPASENVAEKCDEERILIKMEDDYASPTAVLQEDDVADGDMLIGDLNVKTELSINRVPFADKLAAMPQAVQDYFDRVYNAFISYERVYARVSFKCVSFRFKRDLIAKIVIKSKTMKLALALDVNAFPENVYYQKDASAVKAYEQVPFMVKLKSGRAATRAEKLVSFIAEKFSMEKRKNFVPVSAAKEITLNPRG